ncbi:hypothetical protein CBM2599_B50361 [Cupriavidus taiwanensis]|nr:hypothetical protein CBM2600_B10631 [Cupriavidus taiwanensis]SOY96429.1 hypothetical protein CBM2599_B50361 [Cupriavidus taiwanensis]
MRRHSFLYYSNLTIVVPLGLPEMVQTVPNLAHR